MVVVSDDSSTLSSKHFHTEEVDSHGPDGLGVLKVEPCCGWFCPPVTSYLTRNFIKKRTSKFKTLLRPKTKVALCHSKNSTEPQVQHVVVAQDKRGVF